MIKPNLPTVDELVEIIYDLSRDRNLEFPCEVRLNLLRGWTVYHGDPQYDPHNKGAWGSATIEPRMTLSYSRVVAESLISQATDDWYDRAADEIEQERKKPLRLSGKMRVISTNEEPEISSEYGVNYTTDELKDHYRALIGEPDDSLTRKDIIRQLYGTEFDEHAYS